LWYYRVVVFIESRAFTRKLHQLAGGRADEVLGLIQNDLGSNPERGTMVPGLGASEKRVSPIPAAAKESAAAIAICTCTCSRGSIHLLILLDKNEQEDATEEQRAQLRDWVAQVKRDSRG
jgi:hypothetical protein